VNASDDRELARKITALLDRGNEELRQGTAYRLQGARQAALARMAELSGHPLPATVAASELAGAGSASGGIRPVLTDIRLWLGIAALVGAAYFYDDWNFRQQASEIAELDSALLGSDLPVDAFLDKGFENWLKRSRQ
jgi:hypothetical protein